MEKEEVKNVALFGDTILMIILFVLSVVEYVKYAIYTSEGILTPAFWILYLTTASTVLATITSVYYNKRKYVMPAVTISSIFLFLSSLVLSFTLAGKYNSPLLLWLIPIILLIYVLFRAYSYSRD